jgi:MFS family permease
VGNQRSAEVVQLRPQSAASGSLLPADGWRRKAAIAVLLSSAPGMALMFAALGPALPLVAAHFGGQGATTMAQMIMTMPGIGVVAGGAIGGFTIAALGLRHTLFAALLIYALAGSAGLYVGDIYALLVARFLLGVAVAHISNCCLTLMGAWFDEASRAKVLGYQAGVAGAVSVTMLLLGGTLAQFGGWRAPFVLYLMALPVLLLALIAIPKQAAPPPVATRTDWPAILPLWPLYLLVIGLMLAYFMTSVQLTFLLNGDGVSSPFIRSVVIGSGVAAGGLVGGFFGPVYRRLGRRWTRIVLIGLMAAGFALIGLTHDLVTITLGAILCGGGGGMISPYVSSLFLARTPPAVRSKALGFMFMSFYLADFLNPLAVYPFRVTVGIHGAFIAAALILAAGIAVSWRTGAQGASVAAE